MARRYDEFKVVEINNSLALRIGHVVAQQPLAKADIEATGKVVPVSVNGYLDNGFFFKLNGNTGAVKVPADGNATGPVYLGYSDPLLDLRENYGLLKDFAEQFDDGVLYPRLVALYPGDVFTTNNFAGAAPAAEATAIAYVNFATGVLTVGALPAEYVGPKFSVTRSTLPDGETLALEVLVVTVV
jgi:hypothetical protein